MIDIDELWVGDKVLIIPSKTTGTFHAKVSKHKLQVKADGKIILADLKNIKLITEEEIEPDLNLTEEIKPSQSFQKFEGHEIDLHIEKLNPTLLNSRAEHILHHQMSQCAAFMKYAIAAKKSHIKIIHGKGAGVLKSEVHHLLKSYNEVYISSETNQGGALEIIFQYR